MPEHYENIFEWGNQYLVGVEKIDGQHKRLFDIGKDIINSDLEEAKKVINDLCQYSEEHFSTEEAHMRKIGYPAIEEHILLHRKMVEDLDFLIKKGIRGPKDIENVRNFFLYWLLDHVMQHDMQYFHYSRTKNI